MDKTYYALLEVAETASQKQIKSAHRNLAHEYHPDKLPEELRNRRLGKDAVETWLLIQNAYEVLSDPQKRAAYDRKLRELRGSKAEPIVSDPPPRPAPVKTYPEPSLRTPAKSPGGGGSSNFGNTTAVGSGIAVLLFVVLIMIGVGILQQGGRQQQPESPQFHLPPVQTPTEESASARLEAIAYSHSKSTWANTYPTHSHGYPDVYGLGFYNDLGWGAGLAWKGSYAIGNHEINLTIKDLRLPEGIEKEMITSWRQERFWDDVAVGYYVELRGATFEDFTLSRSVLFFHTFAGDKPPAIIEKTLPLLPIKLTPQTLVPEDGEWIGASGRNGDESKKVFRIRREGNTIEGAALEFVQGTKVRCTIHGWILDGKVTLFERPQDSAFGVSLVATEVQPRKLKGYWKSGSYQGVWHLTWQKELQGSLDDLPVTPP